MTWLLGYLLVGLVVSAVTVISRRLRPNEALDSLFEPFSVRKRPDTAWARVLDYLDSALAIVLFSPFWPYVIYDKLRTPRQPDPEEMLLDKPFAVERAHLLWMTTIEEIERKTRVYDPLGAAPELPFGHLNAAWVAFRDQVKDGEQVWTFAALKEQAFGIVEKREGYVVVDSDGPGSYFLTRIERDCIASNEEAPPETSSREPATEAKP